MGLRGATLCLPLLAAVFLRERTSPKGVAVSIMLAPASVVVAGLLDSSFPPLFVGMAVSLTAILLGLALDRGLKVRGGPK